MAGPGLLAHVLVSKYCDHLPLYRQAEIWQRSDIDLDRGTLCRWVMKCGELLKPLVSIMKKEMLASGYVQADETPVQVLSEKGRMATSQSYMWLYKTGGAGPYQAIYDYSPSRSGSVPKAFLGDFKGHLQSDAYGGYKRLAKESGGRVISVGCWAHARRKFAEIAKISSKAVVAQEALEKIGSLYGIEQNAKAKNLTPDQILTLRQEKSAPLLQDLKTWLAENLRKTPPKGMLGKAIQYSLGNWRELTAYLQDGRLDIDNNGAERCIKPFVIGRKNWLFKGNERGAHASATIYSLLETAKSHGVNPFCYMRDILQKLAKKDLSKKDLKKLLPNHWKPPPDKA
jgi:transposase